MRPFDYLAVESARGAVDAGRAAAQSGEAPMAATAQFVAGGTNITDYMRLDLARPEILIDLNHLPHSEYGQIDAGKEGLRFGALVRMSEAEDHPVIQQQYPVIHDTLRLAASRQIRNMATLAGNTLQRTRCAYFRESSWACNKREPGSGCAAVGGNDRQHALLGTSEHCIATYPGDFAQALVALDATIETVGPGGRRRIAFADLHRVPGNSPHIETVLEAGELIAFINVPAGPWTRRSHYVKIRDRESYQFSVVSVAVAIDLAGDLVRDVRIALGGVATVPWRARDAEAVLTGGALHEETATKAADVAFIDARIGTRNAFKIALGKRALVRALLEAKAMEG